MFLLLKNSAGYIFYINIISFFMMHIFIYRRWYPEVLTQAPVKTLKHRAMDDIKESVKELQFYRNQIFKP